MSTAPQKEFHWRCALKRETFLLDVDLELRDGECLGVFGPSGAGKTSLLRCLAGLEKDASVELNGQFDSTLKTGLLFQEAVLFPHLNVAGNLRFSKKRSRKNVLQQYPDENRLLNALQISHLLQKPVWALSGGERKRVALCQLLLAQPEILLLDEALTFLDSESKHMVSELLDLIRRQYGIAMIFVSHDLQELCKLSQRLVLLEAGEAVFAGDIDEVLTSVDSPLIKRSESFSLQPFVSLSARLLEYDDRYGVSIYQTRNGQAFRVLEHSKRSSGEVSLKIEANQVSLLKDDLSLDGKISVLNELSVSFEKVVRESENKLLLLLDANGDKILSQISRLSYERMQLEPGVKLKALIKAASIVDM